VEFESTFSPGHGAALREPRYTHAHLLDVAEEPNWESYPARSWDTSTWVAAPGRARRNLGWHPAVSLRDGLASFARWLSDPAVADQYRSREPA